MLAKLNLEVFFCGDIEANAWLMYGATEVEPWEHWHNFSFNGATGAELLADRIVLHLSDDARGDTDYLTRGRIRFAGIFAQVGDSPVRIEGIRRLPGNELFLRFTGPSGFSYNIQESADLAGWSTIVSTNPITGSSSVFLPASDAPMRIIRILGVAEP